MCIKTSYESHAYESVHDGGPLYGLYDISQKEWEENRQISPEM